MSVKRTTFPALAGKTITTACIECDSAEPDLHAVILGFSDGTDALINLEVAAPKVKESIVYCADGSECSLDRFKSSTAVSE